MRESVSASRYSVTCARYRSTDMGGTHSDTSANSKGDLVARIKQKLATADPEKARQLGGVFLFNIIKGQTVFSWTMDLNRVTVYEGEGSEEPDATFTLTETTLRQLVLGREPARAVLAAGRCSVTGDIMRAMQLEPYIKLD